MQGHKFQFRFKAVLIELFGSQVAAARALGISEWKLSRIIRGWNEPSESERIALTRALGEKVATRILKVRPHETSPTA